MGDPRFGHPQPCDCQRATRQERQAAQAFHASNLTEAMRALTFEQFQLTAQARVAYACAREFAAKPHGWLFLRGGYGVGKTHLLAAITNVLLASLQQVPWSSANTNAVPGDTALERRGEWESEAVPQAPMHRAPESPTFPEPPEPRASRRYPLYVVAPVWLGYIRAGFDAHGSGLSEVAIARKQQAMEADVLLLDDLGAESETAWTQEQLYQVLNARYNTQAPTVIATNRLTQQLEPRIRSRLADWRLVEECVLAGPDRRSSRGRPE